MHRQNEKFNPPLWTGLLIGLTLLLLYGLLFSAGNAGAETAGITDPAVVVTPAAFPRPSVGAAVADPVFGTTVRRVSNTSEGNGWETQTYSQLQAFSSDSQYILLVGEEGYIVRRMSDFSLVPGVDSSQWNAPRWRPGTHSLIHYDSNADTTLRVQTLNVDTGQAQTIYTFPAGWERIRSNQSFDELSHDGRWMGGMAVRSNDDQTLFALDLQNNSLGAQISLAGLYAGPCQPDPTWGEVEPDWVGVSPLGRYLVVQWARDGIDRCSGQETFDINTGAFVGRVYDGHQHGDLGVLPDGTTEFFMTFELYNPNANGQLSLGYRTLPGNATVQEPVYLQVIDWHGAHISCQGANGVCLVTSDAVPEENGWSAFEGELFLQYTDGRIDRLVHHRSSACGYWVQPRASLSRDGRYAIFASDWGQQTGGNSCDGSNENLGRGDPYILELSGGAPVSTATPTATATPTTDDGPQTATPTVTPTSTGTATGTPTATPTLPNPPAGTAIFYTTLDNAQAISAPAAGLGGSSNLQAGDFVPGRAGNGANFAGGRRRAIFPAAQGSQKNIDLAKGELSFWYRPDYAAAADDEIHYLLAVGDIYNVPRLTLGEGDRLFLSIVDGSWTAHESAAPYQAALWQAGEWVHIRAFWDSAAADPIRLFVNGVRVDEGGAQGGWVLGDGDGLSLFVGAGNEDGDFSADGVLDELLIYPGGQPLPTATPTVTPTPSPTTATQTTTPSPSPTATATPTGTGTGLQIGQTAQINASLGVEFCLPVRIVNSTNLGGFEFTLRYLPATLQFVSVEVGDFLGSTGRTVIPVGPITDTQAGSVRLGAASTGAALGPNGNGVLATFCFVPTQVGNTALGLEEAQVTDTAAVPIPLTLAGVTVAVAQCAVGDLDCDGDVDIVDVQAVAARWGSRQGDALYGVSYDLDGDGDIDILDVQAVATRWSQPLRVRSGQPAPRDTHEIHFRLAPPVLPISPSSRASVAISVTNASNLAAFETTLRFDPALLSARSVQMSNWLSSTGRTVIPVGPTIDNVNGSIRFGAASLGSAPGVSGSNLLAWVEFESNAVGSGLLSLVDSQAATPDAVSMPVINTGGNVDSQYRTFAPAVTR